LVKFDRDETYIISHRDYVQGQRMMEVVCCSHPDQTTINLFIFRCLGKLDGNHSKSPKPIVISLYPAHTSSTFETSFFILPSPISFLNSPPFFFTLSLPNQNVK
jgi:hypothetical protein